YDAAQHRDDRGDRLDDSNRDIVSTRLKKFQDEIMPVIEFYRQKGLLIEVDGSKSREEVTEAIIDALATKALI
ncbi:MAG: hypothetical protein WAW60_03430, partial [Candidatus Saccharimonadales bacterium]